MWIIKQHIIKMIVWDLVQHPHSATPTFIIIILCIAQSVYSQPITGTLAANQRGATHTHPLGSYGPNDLIRVNFQASGLKPLTTTSLWVNFDGPKQPNDINLQEFYHQNPTDYNKYDLDAMWEARDQFINLYRPSAAVTTLHLTVFNFDPSYRQASVSYTITIDPPSQTNFNCESCENSQSFASATSCFCTGCSFEKQGKICSRQVQKLQKNMSFTIDPQEYQYFSLEDTQKVTVTINVQGGVAQAYFQFQQFNGQVANYYNVAKGSSDGRYLINNNDLKVGADTQKRPLLITLVSFSGSPIIASISYTVESTVSVLVIVMAVLGSVILVVVIVTVVCIIKKRNAANRVNTQLNLPSQTAKLTGEQIQRYFPTCFYSELQNQPKIQPEASMNPLPPSQKQAGTAEQDCVICLQQIKSSDQIRIGYCKHIFHGPCLLSWFKKQRNCPYCRKQYNRDETVGQYNKLVSENENRVLKDVALAKAIYNKKSASKTYIENLQ